MSRQRGTGYNGVTRPPNGRDGKSGAGAQGTHRATHGGPKAHTPGHTPAHTLGHTSRQTRAKPAKKSRKRRVFPELTLNIHREEKLNALLDDTDPRLRVYIYHAANGKRVGKAFYIGSPVSFRQLLDYLRDDIGGGDFHIMIRRSKKMEISVLMSVGVPLRFRC